MKFEWKKVPIKELCIGIYDGPHATPPKSDSGAIFLGIPNFSNGRLDLSNIRYISEEDLPHWTKRVTPRAHDIVFSYEATLNLYAIIPEGFHGCLGRRMALMRPDETKVDYKFLYYYMFSSEWREEIERHRVIGSTVDRIPLVSFPSFIVNLPDVATQRFIADNLSALDEKIELNNKINDNLEQQAEAMFKAWFIDYLPFAGKKPQEWNNTTIEELTSLVSRGIAPKYTEDSDQIVINQKCIRDHRIDLSLARTHTPKKINEKWLQYGDLLINSTGEGTLGRTAQVWFTPEKMTVDSHVTIVRPKSEELMYYIGFWGLMHEKEIESLHTGSTGQTELPRERIKAMELVLPDQATLAKFNAIVQPMTETIISNQIQNNKLAALRDALLPKLMSGEIEV